MPRNDELVRRLATLDAHPPHMRGRVSHVASHEVRVRGLALKRGDEVAIDRDGTWVPAEVVAVGASDAVVAPCDRTAGIGVGDPVRWHPQGPSARIGDELVGRIVGGLGEPLDGGASPGGALTRVTHEAPSPMHRSRITHQLATGVRAVDSFTPVGAGQRLGVFAGSGVGKSTLLAMMARGTSADVAVIALVGERGREVREFVEDTLGKDGLARSVVVVATSDQPPLVRLRAAQLATRTAEYFADQGQHVLLLLDSVTRLAAAQRELGLAAGEPPTSRGYTPSVFTFLPELLERAGPRAVGSVTGLYTVLVEGDDVDDPIGDAARSILDGHLVLRRDIAVRGRLPAVDVTGSLSRLERSVVDEGDRAAAATVRRVLAAVDEVRDLVEVGAYVSGTNPDADRGMRHHDAIEAFLRQAEHESTPLEDTQKQLRDLASVLEK